MINYHLSVIVTREDKFDFFLMNAYPTSDNLQLIDIVSHFVIYLQII